MILCRDVTELRRRELELMTKDATIREIHHRVKNNLQTVSALLRLQSRRMTTDEARQGLEQAMRRVATIATVHEALSQGLTQNVDFDELIERQFHLAAELASPRSARVYQADWLLWVFAEPVRYPSGTGYQRGCRERCGARPGW